MKFTINLPNDEEEEYLESLGFSVTRDLRKLGIDYKQLFRILRDNGCIKELHQQGDLLIGNRKEGIIKLRLKPGDGRSKRAGYRIVLLLQISDSEATIIHIYDKKKKSDLSEKDKKSIKIIYSDLQ